MITEHERDLAAALRQVLAEKRTLLEVLKRIAKEQDTDGVYASVHPRIVAMANDAIAKATERDL